MKQCILLCFLLCMPMSWTQEATPPPFYFRAKAMVMCFIEDLWVRGISLGTEYRPHKNFSISLDAVHLMWRYEEEVNHDPVTNSYDEYEQDEPRNYLALDIKGHFLNFKSNNSSLYVSAFGRAGEHRIRSNELYPLLDNDKRHLNGNFFDVGVALGSFIHITRNFGIDLHLGAAYRNEFQSYWKVNEQKELNYYPKQKLETIRPSFRITCYFTFKNWLF